MKTLADPVHYSNLRKFTQSPAHYLASVGHDDDNADFRLGRATHSLSLGVQPGGAWTVYEGRRAGKVWEAFESAEKAKNPNIDIFIPSELAAAKEMAKALAADPIARELMTGEYEVPVEWTDVSGRRCATRGLDILNRKKRYLIDLKTCRSAHPTRFAREALWYGYHAQGAFYADAARSLGVDIDAVYVIAVEKTAPFPVVVRRLTPRALDQGRRLVRSWMEQLLVCEASNTFPGYAQSIIDLDVAEEEDLVFGDSEAA